MLDIAPGWTIDVERGPACLFVRLHAPADSNAEGLPLAEHLWTLLEQHLTYRLVLELEDVSILRSYLLGQLVLLQKRVHQHDGMLRLCGLSETNREALRVSRLGIEFGDYTDRTAAVMGARPSQPR